MGWRDGQGGGMMQPQSSLSGFRGGANPLAGTGGVRSPSGPYGPPGFLGGPQNTGGPGGMYAGGPGGTITGGAEPYNAGSSTTGGPSYAVNPGPAPYGGMGGPAPTNYISPAPPGTGGIKPPPGSVGSNEMGYLTPGSGPLLPNDPAWFSSPQGLQQQLAMARRVMGPYAALAPGRAGQPHERVVPGSGPTEGYTSPMDAYRGMRGAERSAAFEAALAGQPRTWYAQELAKAGVNWQGMNQMQQMRAWLNTLPPEKAADYLAKYAALGPNAGSLTIGGWQPGMDPMMSVGPVGSGPFGNGIAS